MENANNSFIVAAPQDGSTVSVVGDIYRIIIGSEQTDGAYALIDMLIPPKGGPVPHSHVTFQKAFYIIDGELPIGCSLLKSKYCSKVFTRGATVDTCV
jgi:hypothetical protein